MKRIFLILMAFALTAQIAAAQQPTAQTPFGADVLPILINARTDLEVLANEQIGGERPAGWSGSLDVSDPQLAILIRLDLELLMAQLVGLEHIPAGWFGAISSTPYAIARDIRHDLELLADGVYGPSIRPPGWAGDAPLMRCDRSTQNLLELLQKNNLFTPTVLPNNPNYCQLLATQIGQFVETNMLGETPAVPLTPTPNTQGAAGTSSAGNSGTAVALAGVGFAFLDRYATKRVGMIPTTERFEPVAASRTLFSNMTLVRGSGFEVFVDYKTTTISDDTFNSLPNINAFGANPHCDAAWCTEIQLIAAMDSPARRSSARLASGQGLISAGTNMIIHYDGDDQNGMTKVRMELCDRPTSTGQAICEPATQVILPDGTESEPVGTVNGLLQFYAPYSYTPTSVRSRTFYTADLWIDPPGMRN